VHKTIRDDEDSTAYTILGTAKNCIYSIYLRKTHDDSSMQFCACAVENCPVSGDDVISNVRL